MSIERIPGENIREEFIEGTLTQFLHQPGKAYVIIWQNQGSYQVEVGGPCYGNSTAGHLYSVGSATRNLEEAIKKYEGVIKELKEGASIVINEDRSATIKPAPQKAE